MTDSAIPPVIVVVAVASAAVAMKSFKKLCRGSWSDTGDSDSTKASSSKGPVDTGKQDCSEPRRRSFGSEEKSERPGHVVRYAVPETQRDRYKRVAEKALRAMEKGSYMYRGQVFPLGIDDTVDGTLFYAQNSPLAEWKQRPDISTQSSEKASLSILNISTLDAARILSNSYRFQVSEDYEGAPPKTGVLNFASATKPGGGFINGADAQEESIARVSTLYESLESREGKKFYNAPGQRQSYYTHGMIYSPGVVVFQNDEGDAVDPYAIEVVSCAAVNAGELLSGCTTRSEAAALAVKIEAAMDERMGRILYLFEKMGVRNIVLGTFGTGVFKNKVDVIARLWARLLVSKSARFTYSFDRVIFAITGDETFAEFHGAFSVWMEKRDTPRAASGIQRSEWNQNMS